MKSTPVAAALAAALLTLAGGTVHAQTSERDLLSERDFLTEIPRVFSASRLPQAPADSPGAVTVIDREMIRALGARDVAEVFRLVPGFVVGQASGGRPVVAYHGLSGQISQRMQVLLDGRSLYAPYLFGGIDWNTLPINLDDIERIEVLRGSNSAAYGANAFLGVANIITRAAAQSGGGHVSTSLGTGGVRDVAARIGGGGNGVDWRLSAGTRGDDGLTGAFDQRRLNYLSGRGEWQINDSDQLSVSAGVNDNRLGLGVASSAGDPQRFENTTSSFGQVRWRRSFSPDHEMSLAASHTSDRGTDRFAIPVTATDALLIDYGRKALRDHFEYQHYLGVSEQIRASWGVEFRKESVVAPQLFNTSNAQRTQASRAYLNAEWSVSPSWTVNAGGLIEHESLSGTHLAPRLTVNWKFDANQALRLGYSDAFRTPALFEQRSDWRFVYGGRTIDVRYLSRGGLKPERVRATELSYLGDFRRFGLNVDARLFRERVNDLITQQRYSLPPGQEFDPESGAFDLRNGDDASITGLEYQLRWRPSANQQWLFGHYMARRSGSAAFVSESIPAHSAHVLGVFRLSGNRTLSVFYGLQSPIRWIGETTTMPHQRRLDVRLEQAFAADALRGTIAIVGQNLLGGQTEFRSGQEMPRRLWLTLSVDR